MAAWIAAIPFADWPQQTPVDGQLRPAMVTDLAWHGFGLRCEPVVAQVIGEFPGCIARQHMLSVVMPGHSIPDHVDEQPPYWLTRVHVPLATNRQALFAGRHLEEGIAHYVNTRRPHGVVNGGETARIHFMFDVVQK